MRNEIYKKTLSNGLRVVLSTQPNNDIIALKLFIRVGSQNDGQSYGITHMLEHALFNNTIKNKIIFYEIERHGGIINANTARDFLSVYIVIGKDYFYKSMFMILDLVFNYTTDEESLEAEKKIILQEMLSHQNSTGAMWDLVLMNYWKKHPLRYPIRGFTESIEKINCKLLEKHYAQFVTPNNMIISCAGNITEEELISYIEEYFVKNSRISKMKKINIGTEKIVRDRLYVNRDLLMTHLFMIFPIPEFNNINKFYFKAISKLLGEGAFSRLYQVLREEKKLVYSVECKDIYYEKMGMFLIYTKCNNRNIEEIEAIINFELDKLRTKLISEDTLSFLKTNYKGSLERNFQTSLSICNSFGIEEVLSSKSITFKDAILNFNQITGEDILCTSVKYLNDPKVIVIGKNNK